MEAAEPEPVPEAVAESVEPVSVEPAPVEPVSVEPAPAPEPAPTPTPAPTPAPAPVPNVELDDVPVVASFPAGQAPPPGVYSRQQSQTFTAVPIRQESLVDISAVSRQFLEAKPKDQRELLRRVFELSKTPEYADKFVLEPGLLAKVASFIEQESTIALMCTYNLLSNCTESFAR